MCTFVSLDKALKYEQRAAELDPLGPVHLTDLASISLLQGDYQGALRLANRALALDSTFLHALIAQTQVYYFLGDTEQIKRVIKVLETLPDVDPGRIENVRNLQALAEGKRESAKLSLQKNAQPENAKGGFVYVAVQAIQLGDFDTAGQMLLKALDEKDGRWIYPLFVHMPEQAPDSEPWQEFWRQPGPHRVAELRRANGFTPHAATFGSGANP
jgi:tetratricopeptide (TPR) repeat protein